MRLMRMLACALWLAVPIAAGAGTLTTIATLAGHNDAGYPDSELVEFNGEFYSSTSAIYGDAGTAHIFRLNAANGHETVVYTFSDAVSVSSLLKFSGKFYGTTYAGYFDLPETLFSFDPSTGVQTVLYTFPAGSGLSKPTALGGLLYGTFYDSGPQGFGGIYSFDPATGSVSTVYSFNGGNEGGNPFTALTPYEGDLYSLTSSGGDQNRGTLFRFHPATATVTTLHSFEYSDGIFEYPISNERLVETGGVLYCATFTGGVNGVGDVFTYNTKTRQFSVTYSFGASAHDGTYPYAPLLAVNGKLYGTTSQGGANGDGTVFSIDPASGTETILHSFIGPDGNFPMSGLVQTGPLLLGLTAGGGPSDRGVAYSIDPSSGQEVVISSFNGTVNTTNSALLSLNGRLFCTSSAAGANSFGSIFEINPHTGGQKTLSSFSNNPNGNDPSEGALVEVGGALFGTTYGGGTANVGTIFRFDPITGVNTTVFSFDDQAVIGAYSHNLINVSGILYGSTSKALFKFDPSKGTTTVIYAFPPTTYYGVNGIIGVNGVLYGTTTYGGAQNSGTVFSYNILSGVLSTIYTFQNGADGENPAATLAYVNGALFGSTSGHKRHDKSTIFQIDPATGSITTLHTFKGYVYPPAMTPVGSVLFGTVRYGLTSGVSDYGDIFRLNPVTHEIKPVYSFTGGADGAGPDSSLLSIGKHLYGTTSSSGTAIAGTVFRYDR